MERLLCTRTPLVTRGPLPYVCCSGMIGRPDHSAHTRIRTRAGFMIRVALCNFTGDYLPNSMVSCE